VFDESQPITTDFAIVAIAASLIGIIYLLYKKESTPKIKYFITIPVVTFIIAQVYLALTNPDIFFPQA